MGMFDTVILPEPIPCATCGEAIESFQTKHFEKLLQQLQVGDVVTEKFISGVLENHLFCDACYEAKRDERETQKVYLVIYHRILVGVYTDIEVAHQKFKAFDKLDLLDFYQNLYDRMQQWRRKYRNFHHIISKYKEYLAMSEAERQKDRASPFAKLHLSGIEDCLAKDIVEALACLLEKGEKGEGTFFL